MVIAIEIYTYIIELVVLNDIYCAFIIFSIIIYCILVFTLYLNSSSSNYVKYIQLAI